MLKIQLYNSQYGAITLGNDQDAAEPVGLSKIKQTVKRGEDNDGIVYSITTNLKYAKTGRDYLQNVYENLGIEAIVICIIWQVNVNTRRYERYYTGKVKMSNYEVDELFVETSTEQTGFEIKLANRIDNDVDLSSILSQGDVAIPATDFVDIPFHSRKIKALYEATPAVIAGTPDSWVVGATYAADDEVNWKQFKWLSKAGGNTGNVPVDGSIWWRKQSTPFQQLSALNFTIPNGFGSIYRETIAYGQIDTTNKTKDEIAETFAYPFGWSIINEGSNLGIGDNPAIAADYVAYLEQTANLNPRNEFAKLQFGGQCNLQLSVRLKHKVEVVNTGGDVDICGSGALGGVEVYAWFEHRSVDNVVKELTNLGKWNDIEGCGDNERESEWRTLTLSRPTLDCSIGDKLYWYVTYRVYGDYDKPNVLDGHLAHDFTIETDPSLTFITMTNESEFAGSGEPVKCVMVYEALQKVLQFITDKQDCLYSDFFGRTDLGYDEDGEGALMAITSGDQIRLRDKAIFANFGDLFKSLTAIWCLGFGVETIDGEAKVRVEKKDHFYDKTTTIITLGRVKKLKKKVAMEYYYSQVEMSFPKMDQATQTNGADETNTIRRFLSPLTQAVKKLILGSVYRTSGYEIEALRRKAGETTDDKVDADKFLVCVLRDGDGYETEVDAGFATTGIYSPETAYNLRVTNHQNVMRWMKVFGCNVLLQANKIFKFSYGEGNYTATVNGVAENGDINCAGNTPLWKPEVYEFESDLSSDQMKLILAAPYGVVKFEDTDGSEREGYLVQVDHEPEIKEASFTLLRVNRNGN